MMTYDEWKELGNKRAEITSALQALGIPIVGWMNEVPTFRPDYTPDWDQIENIATAVHAKDTREWPPYIKKPVKAVVKKAAKKGGAKK